MLDISTYFCLTRHRYNSYIVKNTGFWYKDHFSYLLDFIIPINTYLILIQKIQTVFSFLFPDTAVSYK